MNKVVNSQLQSKLEYILQDKVDDQVVVATTYHKDKWLHKQ